MDVCTSGNQILLLNSSFFARSVVLSYLVNELYEELLAACQIY
jgi:hypothetical protein